ncbi:hypothetical protein BUALT_Bualt11G0088100 [Buddleja alternifolia]|uniref:Uncharacterized protein n=1 Tax=Buddleja alternifolia TaxID=168488 RepID=A0AAV6X0U3_9LAMI|nr:hypothetical protein BUALT_Bualt11G0088100 [Buddleja alternifolia]
MQYLENLDREKGIGAAGLMKMQQGDWGLCQPKVTGPDPTKEKKYKDSLGGYMVAFAGRRYAARSSPAFVANSTYIVTSLALVKELALTMSFPP